MCAFRDYHRCNMSVAGRFHSVYRLRATLFLFLLHLVFSSVYWISCFTVDRIITLLSHVQLFQGTEMDICDEVTRL